MKINVLENGKVITRDMTEEEIAEIENNAPAEPTPNEENAINNFFAGLASADTNSIAKIRALAQEFLNNTRG